MLQTVHLMGVQWDVLVCVATVVLEFRSILSM